MARVLVVCKESKYEWDRIHLGLSHDGIVARYAAEHARLDAILRGHEAQEVARARIRELLPGADLVMMSQLAAPVSGYDAVVSLGGDNSFTYTTHFVGDTPVASVNSDPGQSLGALCRWSAGDLREFSHCLRHNRYAVEEWPRLEASVDGAPFRPATSEYFLGERDRKEMSRLVLVHGDREYAPQKSSGLIVATGAGSTGWYASARRYLARGDGRFAPTERRAAFVVAEPPGLDAQGLYAGELRQGQQLIVHSLNDAEGVISADSWVRGAFRRGQKAVIRLGERPLRVIVPALA